MAIPATIFMLLLGIIMLHCVVMRMLLMRICLHPA